MTDPDLQPLYESAYELAGKLIAASLLGLPITGTFDLDGSTVEDDYRTPAASCTSLTVMFCGAVAKSIFLTGEGQIPDYKSLQDVVLAQIKTSDIAAADPYRAQAWQRASVIMNSLTERLDDLARALFKGEPVDGTFPALQFSDTDALDDDSLDDGDDSLDDDSLDDESLTALNSRQWSSLATCNLNGMPL